MHLNYICFYTMCWKTIQKNPYACEDWKPRVIRKATCAEDNWIEAPHVCIVNREFDFRYNGLYLNRP